MPCMVCCSVVYVLESASCVGVDVVVFMLCVVLAWFVVCTVLILDCAAEGFARV